MKKRTYPLHIGDSLNPDTAVSGYECESHIDRAARMWALALCNNPCPAWYNDPADPGLVHNRDMTRAKLDRLHEYDNFKTLVQRYIAEENAMTDDNRDGSDSIDAAVDGLLCAARAALACGKLPRKTRSDLEWAIGDVEEWVAGIAEQSGGYFDRYIAGDR